MTNTHTTLTQTKNYRGGFSLIELSIVLIILGLLVAGVTGGASLIKSAKVNKICNQLTNLRQAWNSYYVQYGEVAGAKSDGNLDSEQAMQDLVDNGLIESANFNSDMKYFCTGGYDGGQFCKGIAFWFTTNDGDIPEWANNEIIVKPADDGFELDEMSEELNKAIDRKIDDGDPGSGKIRTTKGSDGSYDWIGMCLLLDIF